MEKKENNELVSIEKLKKYFPVKLGAFGERTGTVYALNDITFKIYRGETLGLVGESGCGKSTAGFTILQLHKPTAGKIFYNSRELTKLNEKELRPVRKKMQIVFQDPYSTLSPRMTVGEAISEPMRVHTSLTKKEIKERVSDLLGNVGLNPMYANRYPHEFSGGQRQRICIARALACEPEFIVCDEPISALDVSIQAQIINLLQDLQVRFNLTYLFIAHDLAVVRHISDRIAVMYLGRIVEISDTEELFTHPKHPYTEALLSAAPEPDPNYERKRKRIILTGDVPNAIDPPGGCSFHTRCPIATDQCTLVVPELKEIGTGHLISCLHRK